MKNFKKYLITSIFFVLLIFGLNVCDIGEGMRREIISGDAIITGRYVMISSTMTVYAGREIKFESGSNGCETHRGEFIVSTDATLQALGTSSRPITFVGEGSLKIEASSTDRTRLEYCEFGSIGVTIENSNITITSCTQNGVSFIP